MSNSKRDTLSRFLSYVLRHKPDAIGLSLDGQGWISVEILLEKLAAHNHATTFAALAHVVKNNEKQRFAFNADRTMIRASQGHSVGIDLGYSPRIPPKVLFHGTVARFLSDIQRLGLTKQRRHHVHLSLDRKTAAKVGARRGTPVILEIAAAKMHADGIEFFCSENDVWLTDRVPPCYIVFP